MKGLRFCDKLVRVHHCLEASEGYNCSPEIHVSPCGFASDRHLLENSGVKCEPVLSSPSECESRRCTPATMLKINTTTINLTFEHLILPSRSVMHEGILRTKEGSLLCATSVLSVSRYQPITFEPRRLITQLRLAAGIPLLQPGALGIFFLLSWSTRDMCL